MTSARAQFVALAEAAATQPDFYRPNEIVTILPPPCGYCKLMKFKLLRFGIFIAPKVS
jgi:hypothetical protein